MAETTASIEPCAVCTITGVSMPRSLQPAEDAHAVEIGHDEVEDDAADPGAVRALEQAPRRLAAVGEHRLVAEAADHGVEQPALDRIVVGYENTRGHSSLRGTCRSGTIWAECVNGS